MKHLRKILSQMFIGTSLCLGLVTVPTSAYAATPEEAAELARSLGIPESFIQAGWNKYYEDPELYPPEIIDNYMENLNNMNQEMIDQLIGEYGGIMPTPPVTSSSQQEQNSTATTTATAPEKNGNTLNENKNESGNSSPDEKFTINLSDGSTFERISINEFIAMSLEEKRAYLATLTDEEKQAFLSNLSPEEYKSLLKQLPIDKKAEIIDDMSDVTKQLGLTINVDELTDDDVVLSMKDSDGKLVAVNSARDSVASTGYDRRGIFSVALSLISVGIAGAIVTVRKSFKKNIENEE